MTHLPHPEPRRRSLIERFAADQTSVMTLVFVLIALILVGVAVVLAIGGFISRSPGLALTVTSASHARVDQLQVGHCLKALPVDGQVDTVVAVPCNTPHKAQVVGAWDMAGVSSSAVRPALNELQAAAQERCTSSTLSPRPRSAQFVLWLPTEAGWAAGDRRALCLAQAATLTSSVVPGN
ncbi:septum formation family protein [Rarobacter incanus]|uniref:Putative regulator of septum formation n=1 Tax=Rarobacter incanus TaxID=153494 RepID=A0A542SQE5_9MICO|nr:septum formation family protein [Rarobacter incanus]TQK76822.1 putative regulator of septum formation [Rarobacter incanus]